MKDAWLLIKPHLMSYAYRFRTLFLIFGWVWVSFAFVWLAMIPIFPEQAIALACHMLTDALYGVLHLWVHSASQNWKEHAEG